jgi:hypothetical protein
MWSASVLLITSGAILLLFYGPTIGMIQNLVEPRIRATSTAMFSILYSLFGAGFGPVFVGFTSDQLAAASYPDGDFATQCVGGAASKGFASLSPACQYASALGVQRALQLAVCIFFLAAISYFLAARTLARDLYQPPKVP